MFVPYTPGSPTEDPDDELREVTKVEENVRSTELEEHHGVFTV